MTQSFDLRHMAEKAAANAEELDRLKSEAQKDYEGMREFQLKFMKADHELREVKALLVRAADTLWLSHTAFDPECGICRLIQELRKAAE